MWAILNLVLSGRFLVDSVPMSTVPGARRQGPLVACFDCGRGTPPKPVFRPRDASARDLPTLGWLV